MYVRQRFLNFKLLCQQSIYILLLLVITIHIVIDKDNLSNLIFNIDQIGLSPKSGFNNSTISTDVIPFNNQTTPSVKWIGGNDVQHDINKDNDNRVNKTIVSNVVVESILSMEDMNVSNKNNIGSETTVEAVQQSEGKLHIENTLNIEPLEHNAAASSDDDSSITTTSSQLTFDTLPYQTLEQYKQWHSNDVLLRESSTQVSNRSFAMAYYSCPLQAGNRMHHFLNSIIWAIVTNRTILFKYYDNETCWHHQDTQTQIWHDPGTCSEANDEKECEKVLNRAEWVPTFNKWSNVTLSDELENKINLIDIITVIDYWRTRRYDKAPSWERTRFKLLNDTTVNRQNVDVMTEKIVDFPELVGKDDILGIPSQRIAILTTQSARNRAESLFSEGSEFLYGMLFKNIFKLRWDPVNPESLGIKTNGTNVSSKYSIALHSRHRKNTEGGIVRKERQCLDLLLQPLTESTRCYVCLMSDRPKTIQLLSQYVREIYNCTIFTNDYSKTTEESGSWLSEHGPNAGSSFFRDLDLCQHFTDGFIGTGKGATSSQLLEEWVEYNWKMNHYHLNSTPAEARMIRNRSYIDKCTI